MGSGAGGPGRPSSFVAPELCNFGQGGCVPGAAVGLGQQAFIPPAPARSPKSRCRQGHPVFADSLGRILALPFQLLVAAGHPWFIEPAPHWLPPSSLGLLPCVFVSLCLHTTFFEGHRSLDVGLT